MADMLHRLTCLHGKIELYPQQLIIRKITQAPFTQKGFTGTLEIPIATVCGVELVKRALFRLAHLTIALPSRSFAFALPRDKEALAQAVIGTMQPLIENTRDIGPQPYRVIVQRNSHGQFLDIERVTIERRMLDGEEHAVFVRPDGQVDHSTYNLVKHSHFTQVLESTAIRLDYVVASQLRGYEQLHSLVFVASP